MMATKETPQMARHDTPQAAADKSGGWSPGGMSESAQLDVLRRIGRKADGITVAGNVTTVVMPNKSQVRVTYDKTGVPVKWEVHA